MPFAAAVPLIGAAASIGGALISSNSQKKAQNKAGGRIDAAVGELEGAKNDTLGGDAYKQFQNLVSSYAANPYTYSPEDIASFKANAAGSIQEASRGNINDLYTRAGARGGVRDSSTGAGVARESQRLGVGLAQSGRSIDQMAAQQRIADIAQLGQILQGFFNLRSAPSQAIAQAQLNAAPTTASFSANPFGDVLRGVGSMGASGQLGDLFASLGLNSGSGGFQGVGPGSGVPATPPYPG